MQSVTISPKFQVVIPKEVRKGMGLRPGQKLKVIQYDIVGDEYENRNHEQPVKISI